MGHADRRDNLCLSTVVTVRAARPLEGSTGGGVADLGPVQDTNPDLPSLQPLASAIERGTVSREDGGQQCTVAGPLVVVGGGGVLLLLCLLLEYYLSSHSSGAWTGCGTWGVGIGYSGE